MVKSLLLLVLILCTTLVATHSRVIQPNGANIVQQTCSMTPNPALCIQYLNTDPKSSTSDVNGLAQIMFDVLKLKANIAIGKINQLTRSIPTKQNDAVLSCIISYRSILIDVLLSTQALEDGNPNFAVHNANYAAEDVNDCEKGFYGKSPFTAENNVVRDAAAITSAICKLLL